MIGHLKPCFSSKGGKTINYKLIIINYNKTSSQLSDKSYKFKKRMGSVAMVALKIYLNLDGRSILK